MKLRVYRSRIEMHLNEKYSFLPSHHQLARRIKKLLRLVNFQLSDIAKEGRIGTNLQSNSSTPDCTLEII